LNTTGDLKKGSRAVYWAVESQPYHYILVKEFAETFHLFHVGKDLLEELSHPYDRKKNHPTALTSSKYGVSRMNIFKAFLSREWLLMKRNSFVYVFKTVQVSWNPNFGKPCHFFIHLLAKRSKSPDKQIHRF